MSTISNTDRMTALCKSMHYLADKPGFGLGWDPGVAFCVFPRWASGSSAAIEAVRFVRHVWNSENPAPSLAYWDHSHRAAFVEWAKEPWWC